MISLQDPPAPPPFYPLNLPEKGNVLPSTQAPEQLFIKTADRVARTLYQEKNPVFLERYYLSAGAALARREQRRDDAEPA